MVRSERPGPAGGDQSLGDLVAMAAKDVSQLLRYEIELAKTELRADLQRIGLAGGLGGLSFYFVSLMLLLLCFAYAYGLIAAGIWAWAAFLIVAGTVLLLAGLRLTKKTVNEDLDMLRREGLLPGASPDGQRPGIAAGPRPEIPAREPR
jgi:Putative Actinobacterial Holin-X, holin superfamily III